MPAPGKEFEGIGEVDALCLLHEAEHVTALPAPEAVIEPAGPIDGHRRGLLLVERANGHEAPARSLDLGDLGDQVDEIGGFSNPIDVTRSAMVRRS